MKKLMKKLMSVIIGIVLISSVWVTGFCLRVILETQKTDDNKTRIYLKWDEPNEMGIHPLYYLIEDKKIMTIGYEIREMENQNAYMDVDISNIPKPLIIVPQEVGDNIYPIFTDIKGNYGEDYIKNLYAKGVLNGMPDRSYEPNSNVTRAEFVTMLCKILKLSQKEEGTIFSDLNDHWANPFFQIIYENGYINGYSDGTMRPDNLVSIAEACAVISKAFNFEQDRKGYYQKLKKGKWFSDCVKKIFDAGILNTQDVLYRDFDEDNHLNRADISIMLSRAAS